MISAFPIQTLLPDNACIDEIVTLGSGKLPESVLIEKALRFPSNYIRVVKPQYIDQDLIPGSFEFYDKSKSHFDELIKNSKIVPQVESIYYYNQKHNSGVNLGGWIVGIDADDYLNGRVKKHENTIKAKEERLVKHIHILQSMAEPVLLSTILPDSIKEAAKKHIDLNSPILEIADENKNIHQLWQISDGESMNSILSMFNQIESLYIADGHHRVSSTSQYIIQECGHNSGKGFMSLIMDEGDLLIKPFYRLLKDIDSNAVIPFLETSNIHFEILNEAVSYESINKGEVVFYSNEFVIKVQLPELSNVSAKDKLDVSITEKLILFPLFQLQDSSQDARIGFLRGDTPVNEIMQKLAVGAIDLAILFHPNSMEEIRNVADENEIMPPKSTFIEPKLLTGMVIEDYKDR